MEVDVVIAFGGSEDRRVVSLSDGILTIGRSKECTIALESHAVSRTHATIDLNGAMMRVRDSSTNGTRAGDQYVSSGAIEVPKNSPIQVGDYVLSFRVKGSERPATPPPVQAKAPAAARPGGGQPSIALGNAHLGLPVEIRDVVRERKESLKVDALARGPLDAARARSKDDAEVAKRRADVELRREIHGLLLKNLDLGALDPSKGDDGSLRTKVLNALREIVASLDARIPPDVDKQVLIGEMVNEALGLGPLESFLGDSSISEIMVVDPQSIYIEQKGKLTLSSARFTDDSRVRAVIERIVTPLGRRIDESSPIVDARLPDGSRVNAVIRPLALRGAAITIRKFSKTPLTLDNLISYGALTEQMGRFLTRCVVAKRNVVISGGTGSGKTTLLNVLSAAIPPDERVVTIEDAAELQLKQPHVVALETRPANMEGKGEYTIRDLVKNALRMRPDRIVVGECRGGEALDMLQAMNTGHDGSLTTTHANSPREAIARLETLCLMAGIELPIRAIREQIAGSVHVLVQQSRLSDGSRKVTSITEVIGIDDGGDIEIVPIFGFTRTGTSSSGKVEGEFRATGFLPTFLNEFIVKGLIKPGENYL